MYKIVVCGSMSSIEKMKNIANQLDLMGYATILPNEDDWGSIPKEKISEYKGKVSMGHFSEIAKEDVCAILVVNEMKNGIDNYIGANSFAEIAIAFYFEKKIFLLHDIYDPFRDELLGWGVKSLNGEIDCITQHMQSH